MQQGVWLLSFHPPFPNIRNEGKGTRWMAIGWAWICLPCSLPCALFHVSTLSLQISFIPLHLEASTVRSGFPSRVDLESASMLPYEVFSCLSLDESW
jgi:threonine/homoserine efflux transporter RhtA